MIFMSVGYDSVLVGVYSSIYLHGMVVVFQDKD